MSGFPLPAELKLSIAELLPPSSSFAFALTCRDHWDLCKSLNDKHTLVYSEFGVFDTVFSPYGPWDLLDKVLETPWLGEYVRELSSPIWGRTFWETRKVPHQFQRVVSEQNSEVPEELVVRYIAAARDLQSFFRDAGTEVDGVGDLIAALLEPDASDEPIVSILLHHLPDLRVLRFTDSDMIEQSYTMVNSIAHAYNSLSTTPFLPFQHLTTVAVASYESEGVCFAHWAKCFLAIPSVRNFAALGIGAEYNFMSSGPGPEVVAMAPAYRAKSNVKGLLFVKSKFNTDTLADILGGIASLEKFAYDGKGGTPATEWPFNVKWVFHMLGELVGHSLLHLNVEHEELDKERISADLKTVSLKPFQKLKTLKCVWKMIYPETRITVHIKDLGDEYSDEQEPELRAGESPINFDLATSLPESLEMLHLFGEYEDDEWNCVDGIIESTTKKLPNLKSIYVERMGWDKQVLERRIIGVKKNQAGEALPGIRDDPLRELLRGHGYEEFIV